MVNGNNAKYHEIYITASYLSVVLFNIISICCRYGGAFCFLNSFTMLRSGRSGDGGGRVSSR